MNQPRPVITSDRLYSITCRPHEFALNRDAVRFQVRYAPIFDDPAEVALAHFKVLVLEAWIETPEDASAGRPRLELLKCGWELELTTAASVQVGTLSELPDEIPLLLSRIAATVNDLARRAGIEPLISDDAVTELVLAYRRGGG